MDNKTCLITGASTGIGYETALGIAQLGARVIIASKNNERGPEAVNNIARESNNSNIEYMHVDLASFASIRALAAEVRSRYDKLDVMINNAGVYYSKQEFTADNIEKTIGINHLAHFLLNSLLLDRIKASGEGRIISVSSRFHFQGKLHFDNLYLNNKYNGLRAYCQSKLANILYIYKLADILKGTKVTANCLHPGTIRTNIGNTNSTGLYPMVCNIVKPFLPTPKTGAQTSIYLASANEVKGISGKYFQNSRPIRSSRKSYSKENADRLWKMSEALTEIEFQNKETSRQATRS